MMATLIWTLLFFAFVGYFLWQCSQRWKVLRKARKDDGRDYTPATFATRVKNTLVYAFGQKKFFYGDQPAGVLHAIIFWGFLVLGVQVVTMFMRGWFPSFVVPGFTGGLLGKPYALIKDLFEFAVSISVVIAMTRWVITKPERLMGYSPSEDRLRGQAHFEAVLILGFIFVIMWSGLFYDAALIVLLRDLSAHVAEEAAWQPISRAVAAILGDDPARGESVLSISWWTHNLVILAFLNLLPRSKHFHIITAIPNVFFGRVDPKGKLPKKDYEAEDAIFGRSQAPHFTQKQILDMYSCTECGRCASVCPAQRTHKVLAPRQFLLNLRDHVYEQQPAILKQAAGAEGAEFPVVVGEGAAVADEVIWSCVACRACEEACPVNIEYVDKIVDIRQHLVQEVSRFPEELNRAFKGLETNSNPWGISSAERTAWSEGLDVPTVMDKPDAEYLYYVGCGGSFDQNNKKATRSFVNLLKRAGVDFAILGQSETCNGETARRLGNEYLFQTMADMLVNTINETKIKKILVNCPHCFNTMKNEYPDFGGEWEVIHAASFVSKLVDEGKLKIDQSLEKRVVYHDSCYYGRFNDVYDEPRNLINKIPGTELFEMYSCKRNGTCCGAGGGRMWVEEDKDKRVNIMRTEEALEQKPDIIATSCPYCKIMIGSAVNEKGVEDKVQVLDVMEMVAPPEA